ncbi:MAG TPA: M28 family peptidase [Pirellulales bacterium]|jgi:hypothetical protein|nr:M28 family peptidase [Pirellulales bacterium]
MAERGWKQLLANHTWFHGKGKYPISAYSEYMPPPRLGCKPYGSHDRTLLLDDDPFGWGITEFEEAFEMRPGLMQVARQLVTVLHHLGRCQPAHGISQYKLRDNPFWTEHTVVPQGERYVVLAPLALSQTQDDKGRVRWTLFGASEQGPAKAFWRGFYTEPGVEWPVERSLDFIRRLLAAAYGEPMDKLSDLKQAGFRVMADDSEPLLPHWRVKELPNWTGPLIWKVGQKLAGVKYLLTFEPYERLPAPVRRAYLSGDLHLLPFPGSLVFWGSTTYNQLAQELAFSGQIALLHSIVRREAPGGFRVPQSGWLHEPQGKLPPGDLHGPLRNTFQRTHRWSRVHRYEDELACTSDEDRVAHVLFSTQADDLGLYGKPMARNCQFWTRDFHALLDGPRGFERDLIATARRVADGGLFGYRFYYPPLRVGRHAVFYHRPLVAYLSNETGLPAMLPDAPLGYLTAYRADKPDLDRPIELWPRLLDREPHRLAVEAFQRDHDARYHRTTINLRKIFETRDLMNAGPLEPSFARSLVTAAKQESLSDWLKSIPIRASSPAAGERMVALLHEAIQLDDSDSANGDAAAGRAAANLAASSGGSTAVVIKSRKAARTLRSLSYSRTAKRSYEKAYWNLIAELATGQYVNKDNADCVRDPATQSMLGHHHRDLEALGDFILDYYRDLVQRKWPGSDVLVGDLPFRWQTEFPFPWMGGWLQNQNRETHERDLIVVIPGGDRSRAVVMADHYDTAYMEDTFGYAHGGHGPRLSAAGADDNHSATAALLLGAEVFLDLSRAGKLDCDIWLVHLTGEEFPSDCMGARHLCQQLVQNTLQMRLRDGTMHDLSRTRVQGLYVLDMVAHNNDRNRDVFQICPGHGRESMWLAYQAHRATEAWNASVPQWNQRPERVSRGRGRRTTDGTMPEVAAHPQLSGEVRTQYDPHSTLFNTDGQIFSDAGVPCVLFMENYDINRKGYHDTHDTLENIDLDYGAAVSAIAIESVARAATEPPPRGN